MTTSNESNGSRISLSRPVAAGLALVVAAATAALTMSSTATAAAGDPLLLGTTNSSGNSGATTYLNWDKGNFPVQEVGIAVVGNLAGAVFATNEEYMGNQSEWITGIQAYGNDVGGSFYGVDVGATANSEYVGLEASAYEFGVRASGGTAIEATGRRVGLEASGETAIQAVGGVSFSTAGLAKVAKGATSVTVSAHSDVTGSSKVLATVQSTGGELLRVARNTTADTITIHLKAPATRTVTVAYFVLQ